VIKSFSLRDGSSLPQIVRESRALDAAKRQAPRAGSRTRTSTRLWATPSICSPPSGATTRGASGTRTSSPTTSSSTAPRPTWSTSASSRPSARR
jgi:hypothetical protein